MFWGLFYEKLFQTKLTCSFNISLLFSPPVVSRTASGAAVDRYESDRQRHTTVINLDTTKDRRVEEESRSVSATTAENGQDGEEYGDYYYEDEYEGGMSGDYGELPRSKGVCHFHKVSHHCFTC